MRLTFTNDASFLNAVANHPSVRPWLGTDGESFVDIGVLLALPGAFALQNEHGGFVFTPCGDGAFEFHTQFLPEGRGRHALEAALMAGDALFNLYGAQCLKTYVPHENRAALGLVRFIGFSKTGSDDANSYWEMTADAWKARNERNAPTM